MRNAERLLQLHKISDTNTPPRGGLTSTAKFDFGRILLARSERRVVISSLLQIAKRNTVSLWNICADF